MINLPRGYILVCTEQHVWKANSLFKFGRQLLLFLNVRRILLQSPQNRNSTNKSCLRRKLHPINRAANKCRSSYNGRPKFANVRRNHDLGWTFCPANFLLQHLSISFTKKFDFLICYSFECTFVFMSDQIFLLSDQNGTLVGHMSFQGKKIIWSPASR